MHGCPPQEIESIAAYLLREKRLHTAIKLNPTLLGKKSIDKILLESGFDTMVPSTAFEHDLKMEDAVPMINNLQELADSIGLDLTLKLTNTLECINHRDVFPVGEKMMYMSGRALHPIALNLAFKISGLSVAIFMKCLYVSYPACFKKSIKSFSGSARAISVSINSSTERS